MVGRIAALAVILALFATACSSNAPTSTKSSPSPSPLTAGSVVWTDCGGGFQCGTVKVPLDYSHPAAGTIDIALNRMPATDQAHRIGSLLTNPGGPGASGISFLQSNVQVASLDHAMWFHRPFRADDWLLYSCDSPTAQGARGLARGQIFSADGRLVASTAQEGMMRVVDIKQP